MKHSVHSNLLYKHSKKPD